MGRVVASAYLASQLALAHVTLGALFRTKHLLGMGAFLLYMVPSELSHFLLLFDTLVLVRIYRRRDDPNSVLGSVIGRSATALHAFLTLLHAVLLYRNIRSRRHFVAAFAKAGIPLALSPLALPLLMRRMGSRVRVRRNIPIFISSIPPKRRRLAEMDVYSLPNVADDAPYFVYIHGGGWIGGDKKFAALPLLHRVAEAGWVVVSINYGLAPRNALVKQVADVKYAIHMIKRVHGKTFGGNPNIMVVGGESAGGHLAVLTALTQNDPTVRSGAKLGKDVSYLNMGCIYHTWAPPSFSTNADTSVIACVDFCGVHDLFDADGHFSARDGGLFKRFISRVVVRRRWMDRMYGWIDASLYSPKEVLTVHLGSAERAAVRDEAAPTTATIPPILSISGTCDNLVPPEQTHAFFELLGRLRRACGQPVDTDIHVALKGAHHAFHYIPSVRTEAASDAVIAFIEKHRKIALRSRL